MAPDGNEMTADYTSVPIGSALRIAPGFMARSIDDATGIETTIEANYVADRGRYVMTSILSRAMGSEFDENRLKHAAPQAILQIAVPHCVALRLDESTNAEWTAVSDLTKGEGRIIPDWMARAVVKRGTKDERWEVVEILYGIGALADLPPVKLICRELEVPERTAVYWIQQARALGYLAGMSSNVGRPANG